MARLVLITLLVGCGSSEPVASERPAEESPSEAPARPAEESSSEVPEPATMEPTPAAEPAEAVTSSMRRRRRRSPPRERLEADELCAGVAIDAELRRCTADDQCKLYYGPCSVVGARADAEHAIEPLVERCRGDAADDCLGVSLGLARCRDGLCEQGPGL